MYVCIYVDSLSYRTATVFKPASNAAFSAADDCSNGPEGPIGEWDVSSVTDMSNKFSHHVVFNGDISKWDVSGVTSMLQMFNGASAFNGDISKWDVSRVTSMFRMFYYAADFDGDISKWDVSRVTTMENMFSLATAFNGDISKWDVSRVTTMERMFSAAESFSRTLCGAWAVSTADETNMFYYSNGKLCASALCMFFCVLLCA